MSPEQIVRDFCAAVRRTDLAEIVGFFAPDAVYHNIPLDPVRGNGRDRVDPPPVSHPGGEVEFEIKALAVTGQTVLTERVDRFEIGGKRVELPVMGAFEVDRAGRITAWRDYFDMQQFTKQLS
jgi:limonene-1,2-epoxide hydrolase